MKSLMSRVSILSAFYLILGVSAAAQPALEPAALTCEYLSNPLGIDAKKPVFSWKFTARGKNEKQAAYELIVSDGEASIRAGKGNTWSTGRIESDQNVNIVYEGADLRSFTRYFWRVRVYNDRGIASAWSDPAWFETAMMDPADWQAKWVGDGSANPAKDEDYFREDRMPLFRKQFTAAQKIASARLYISG
ncbi:MAG TPA: hypothetical protein VF490_12060, partial [Chryseosolibacter sp.]